MLSKAAAVLALLPLLASGQNLVPVAASSSFPACALTCPLLLQAQQSCIPPVAPVTSEAAYTSCFCKFSSLAPLYTSPNGVCDSVCTNPTDLATLQTWFKGFCASEQGTTVTTAVSGTATSSSTSATSTTGAASSSSGQTTSSSHPQTWFDTHWRWVVMLIVLAICLPAFAFLISCLKRRSNRKREMAQLAHNGGAPVSETREYQHHNFFGGRWKSSSNNDPHARDFGSDNTLRNSGQMAGSRNSVAGKTEMWGPHQGTAHTRGMGEYSYSTEDLRASSVGRNGFGGKSAETTVAVARGGMSGIDEEEAPSGAAGQVHRERSEGRKKTRSRSNKRKGKDRAEEQELGNSDSETEPEARKLKRRSRSQRDTRAERFPEERDPDRHYSM